MARPALTNEAARAAVIALAGQCAARGWTPATAGNFSVRIGDGRAAVTRSGADKGRLTPEDVLLLPLGEAPPKHASAEAAIHWRLYREDRAINAVAHAHPPATVALSLGADSLGGLRLEGLELLKALPGIATHETSVTVPVLSNTQDMTGLAERLTLPPRVPALILRGHGIYAWGEDTAAAFRHMEALEHMFELEWRRRALR